MPLSPEWKNLPRRKCDDCGKSYKPVRPVLKDQRGFCSANCRKSYHKHGGAYRKLKGEMQKMVAREFAGIQDELNAVAREFAGIQDELNALHVLWRETESRYVALAGRMDECARRAS